jgi:prolyl-tRNA synthetase
MVVRDEGEVMAEARRLVDSLAERGVRVRLDARVDTGFGRRAVDWELKGVPVRVEVGPRDLAEGQVTVVRRDVNEKVTVPLDVAIGRVVGDLDEIQARLFAHAVERRDARTADVTSVEEAVEAAKTGFARISVADLGPDGEDRLAAEAVTVRCLQRPDGGVPESDAEPDLIAWVARSY